MQRAQLSASYGILHALFLIHFLLFVEDAFKQAWVIVCSASAGEAAGAKGKPLEISIVQMTPLKIPNSLYS